MRLKLILSMQQLERSLCGQSRIIFIGHDFFFEKKKLLQSTILAVIVFQEREDAIESSCVHAATVGLNVGKDYVCDNLETYVDNLSIKLRKSEDYETKDESTNPGYDF